MCKCKTTIDNPISEPKTYFDNLVNIYVNYINQYYNMVRKHTNKSFIICIVMAACGFLTIISGIFMIMMNKTSINISIIVSASGIIIEFMSAVCFYLYNKTVMELEGYFKNLVHVQNVLLTFKVANDYNTTNQESKDIMMHKVLEYIWTDRPLLIKQDIENNKPN